MENVCSRGFKIWRILAVDLMFLKWESILAEASKIMFKFGEGERKRERGGGGMGGIFFSLFAGLRYKRYFHIVRTCKRKP